MAILLDEPAVRAVLPMTDLIPAMERALAAFSAGEVQQPVRTVLEVGADRAYFGVMPAYTGDAMGAKLVTVFAKNLEQGLPSHLATILLLDPATGALAAILDGRYITEARTAAVSAVSARHLARPDAAILAILGSGVQATSHLEALRLVRDFREVRVWSPTAAHRERFAAEHGIHASGTAEEAVRGADVIALVTASKTPVLESAWVQDGAHVISVGACVPSQQEMDPALVRRARLIVDSRAAAVRESGDVIAAGSEHIAGELGEVAAGRVAGREHAAQVTVFKSLGLAVEDVAAASLALQRARRAGTGKEI